ncbi:PTS cellobiose transporter subunit IIA [uncultured Lactobacillus sp.]|uniref:PTS cellobiose transporter subunit IIA n=1 Tax=uncultured Lactobacillus sp. TaxID=153152 RepID=UPI0026077648|nr:PTS cellobiose transporter subunit IIA [uncultured Lactobacillus sp.]
MAKKDPELEAKKHDMSVRSMYFSRYLMIRYFSAAYVFTNLFWLVFSVSYQDIVASIVAGILLTLILIASIEQASKWHKKDTDLRFTTLYYGVQLISNVLLAAICYSPLGKVFFPFMTTSGVSHVIFTILIAGILGCILILKRIQTIQSGKDKYLRAIKTFERNRQ